MPFPWQPIDGNLDIGIRIQNFYYLPGTKQATPGAR